MRIEQIKNLKPLSNGDAIIERSSASFGHMLQRAIDYANEQQKGYDELLKQQMMGEEVGLHNITIAAEKAKLTLDLTIQIRNKAIEAYQDIMRMQV